MKSSIEILLEKRIIDKCGMKPDRYFFTGYGLLASTANRHGVSWINLTEEEVIRVYMRSIFEEWMKGV